MSVVFEAFQKALRDFLGLEFDLEHMRLVPCSPAAREPFLGSKDNPCHCTSCKRRVFIDCDPSSPLYGRWRLFEEDVSPCRDGSGKNHYMEHKGKDGVVRRVLVDDRARDTRFGGLHHWRCAPSNELQLQELLSNVRGAVARAAAKGLGLSVPAQKAAAAAAAAAEPTESYEDAAKRGAEAAAVVQAEEAAEGAAAAGAANAMEVEEPGADEPGAEEPGAAAAAAAAEGAPTGPPYVCASCFKSLQNLSKIKSHIVKGRTGVACVMGAELGDAACRKSTGARRRLWRPRVARPALGSALSQPFTIFWRSEPLTPAEAATRDPADPFRFLGKTVSVDFGGDHGVHKGTVESFDRETGYHVKFEDGDDSDYGILELSKMLSSQPPAP